MNQPQTAVFIQKPGEQESAPRNLAVPLPVKDALFLCTVAVLIWRGLLGLSLVAGMIFALTLGHPCRKAGSKVSKWLFQSCVVMLGFGMDLEKVLRSGGHALAFH